jgi:hypothetical protein
MNGGTTNVRPTEANRPDHCPAKRCCHPAHPSQRLKRVHAIETGIFASGQMGILGAPAIGLALDPAQLPFEDNVIHSRTWLAQKDNFLLLALHEQRTLRAERKVACEKALEEALLLAQHAESKGEKYDAAVDFPPELLGINSVFSVDEIHPLVARNQRLNQARDYAKTRVMRAAA